MSPLLEDLPQAKEVKDFLTLKRCSRCVYHEKTPGIFFDENRVCNYCKIYDQMNCQYPTGQEGRKYLNALADQIRRNGAGKQYDCMVGVSGGCDSSFMLYQIKELGLRPLAVHFDNTWNSKIAVENLHRMLKALNVDLYTHVVDNEEYDDLCKSFLKAGVPDLDIPNDIGLATTLYQAAEKYDVKYIFEGHSFRTEGISPLGWTYMDGKYIDSLQKKFGSCLLKTFPNLWISSFLKWVAVDKIRKIRPLYYVDYHKEKAKAVLIQKFGWQWYNGHHLENRFTAFCQSYVLPVRFGIDKRANGFSALVRSGQMTREEALTALREPPHLEDGLMSFVKKRLRYSDAAFERVMRLPKRTYQDYKTYKPLFERLRPFFWFLYRADLVPKSFYIKYALKSNQPKAEENTWGKIRKIQGSKMYLNWFEHDQQMRKVFRIYAKKKVNEKFSTALFSKAVMSGDTVVDLGANIGYYTLLAGKLVGSTGKVFAFEPEPRNYGYLLKNIKLNQYHHVQAFCKAVSNQAEKADLYFCSYDIGHHTLYQNRGIEKFRLNLPRGEKKTLKVETVRLDDFIEEIGTQIQFIKMDIEGSEPFALDGMRKMLQTNRNLAMLVEFFPLLIREMGRSPEAFADELLHQYGFKMYAIGGDYTDWHKKTQENYQRINSVNELMELCDSYDSHINLYLVKDGCGKPLS